MLFGYFIMGECSDILYNKSRSNLKHCFADAFVNFLLLDGISDYEKDNILSSVRCTSQVWNLKIFWVFTILASWAGVRQHVVLIFPLWKLAITSFWLFQWEWKKC